MDFTVKDILNMEVAPALGCTEPVAVALSAAVAASLLPDKKVEAIDVDVDPNIYKNGFAVTIPGTFGGCGLPLAAAVGALGGNPILKLQVLEGITEEEVTAAKKMVREDKVTVQLNSSQKGLYIHCSVKGVSSSAECTIKTVHDNIVHMALDGQSVTEHELLENMTGGSKKKALSDLETWLKKQTLSSLLQLIDNLDEEDLNFIERGIAINQQLADYGLKFGPGLGAGKALDRLVRQRFIKKDMVTTARILASSAADARMSGVKLPAMSSAGSGNHGLTAILPIVAVKQFTETDDLTLKKAVALSHIITGYIKAHTGRLSAICGCSVAAGSGATAGIAYLLGGTAHHIAGAIKNLIEDLAGIICDGAKSGCALKLATAAGTAVQAALFSLQGVTVQDTDGIICKSPEDTMKNIGMLTSEGMIETDRTILKIMLEKQFSQY